MVLGEPLRFFISSCFHFFRCLWMSSLLIAFVHFTSLFVRYFSFVLLLHCKCYGFERAFFTVRRFLPYTPSQHLAQPAFIKASLGVGSSSLKVARPPTEVWNTDLANLYVWITQCSAKGINWWVLSICLSLLMEH